MWTEEYQAELLERLLRVAAERDFVVGTGRVSRPTL
jgi:hypothetical protein